MWIFGLRIVHFTVLLLDSKAKLPAAGNGCTTLLTWKGWNWVCLVERKWLNYRKSMMWDLLNFEIKGISNEQMIWYKNNLMWVWCEVIFFKLYVGFCCSLWWWSHAYYKTWTGNVLFYMASYCQTQKTVNTKIFRNVDCVVINHKVQDMQANLKTTNWLPFLFAV